MHAVSQEHYENFPVASWLCPPHLRGTVMAIYGFARTADDIADEGDALPPQRMAQLQDFQRALHGCARGEANDSAWPQIFAPLGQALRTHRLPLPLLDDLLGAFMQDVVKSDYADRSELLDYCRRSASPVGRLLLHLYGVDDALSLRRSDAICSALQLINFWQDLSVDGPRGRLYAPLADLQRHGLTPQQVLQCQDSPAARALIRDLCTWARTLMLEGAPLVHRVPGRAGWELRLVVQGGLRILERIERMQYDTLQHRPVIKAPDVAVMIWRAFVMRPAPTDTQVPAA
ncbi:MAG: squalene synthase HpnC [Burkholderiaceae bacterium]|nr:squalene synthase HpnC [Burkholderiaceae bacterium]